MQNWHENCPRELYVPLLCRHETLCERKLDYCRLKTIQRYILISAFFDDLNKSVESDQSHSFGCTS